MIVITIETKSNCFIILKKCLRKDYMSDVIKLTIQEIVDDFEKLIRYDEHLDVLIDFKKADEKEIDEFHDNIVEMCEKYLPKYRSLLEERFQQTEDDGSYESTLNMYQLLYANFKEIFYKLLE